MKGYLQRHFQAITCVGYGQRQGTWVPHDWKRCNAERRLFAVDKCSSSKGKGFPHCFGAFYAKWSH